MSIKFHFAEKHSDELGYSKSHCEIQEEARRMTQAVFITLCSSLWQDVFPFQAFTVLGCEAHRYWSWDAIQGFE